jgi:hypothetical protein
VQDPIRQELVLTVGYEVVKICGELPLSGTDLSGTESSYTSCRYKVQLEHIEDSCLREREIACVHISSPRCERFPSLKNHGAGWQSRYN